MEWKRFSMEVWRLSAKILSISGNPARFFRWPSWKIFGFLMVPLDQGLGSHAERDALVGREGWTVGPLLFREPGEGSHGRQGSHGNIQRRWGKQHEEATYSRFLVLGVSSHMDPWG